MPIRPDAGGRSTVYGMRGAVACEHPQAALAGIRVLEEGGNAVDACVAMAATLAVVAPMTTGMGGDAFLLFYEAKSGRVVGACGAGGAPRGIDAQKLRDMGLSRMPDRGALTVTVPGAVRLWEDAARELGRLPLGRLLENALRYAREGCIVAEVVGRYWETAGELLRKDEAAARCFLPGGRVPRAGQRFLQPDLARTLEVLCEGGADAFYEGEIARRIARSVREAGGFLSEEDLAEHQTEWVEPISTDYRGVRVYEIPPPTQGIAALEMLGILEGFELAELDPLGAGRVHLEVEAKKLAFRDLRERVGDPDFCEVPVERMLSKEYAAGLREEISRERAAGVSRELSLGSDTTYLCAVDEEGNGCSFINSLYKGFGSGIVAGGTGVCLQNRGACFTLEEGHPNELAPGKRPLHTIIPALATREGALWAVFGVMGGPMQPQGHAQLLADLLDYGMSPQEAADHPRHFHDGETLLLEGRYPERTVEELRRMGHAVEVGPDYAVPTGGAQVIRILEGGVRACGSDPRKDGCALAQ